jgi:hypothetical protein
MSLETGLAYALLIVVLGAGGLTAFALYLRNREQKQKSDTDNHLKHA